MSGAYRYRWQRKATPPTPRYHRHAWREVGGGLEQCDVCHDSRTIELQWSSQPFPQSEDPMIRLPATVETDLEESEDDADEDDVSDMWLVLWKPVRRVGDRHHG